MPPQNHVILREIVEVTVPGGLSAQAVQATFARVLRDAVPALVEQRCDEWSSPGTIHRLDTLVVDLGHLPFTGLEDALTRTLATAFPARLDEAMHGANDAAGGQRVAPAASALELVGHFLRTGALPWWAGRPDPGTVSENLRLLCLETPPDLLPNLRAWIDEPAALARLVRTGADDDLRRLLTVLRPADAEWLGALPDTLCALASPPDHAVSFRPEQVRHEVWQSVLSAAARPSPTDRAALLADVIQRVSTNLQWPAQALIDALSPWSGNDPRHPDAGLAGPVPPGDDFSPLLAHLRASGSPLAGWLAAMDGSPDRLPADLRADLHALLARCEQSSPWPRDDFYRWLRTALTAGALPHHTLKRWLDQTGSDRSAPVQELRATVAAALTTSRPDPSETRAPTPPSRFDDAEALYVDNAGLVILWPFLSAFFTRLGLVVEKQFPDEAARHRAVTLLQCLLTPEPEPPPEYFLPLNKVLCGLLPTALFEPGPPVTDEEQAECAQFLTAVIEQAPILRRMSLPGFRGTFLARQGQLSTRDGAWLLRVERETYDVVLERFPWSFQWVRLPWMDAPMFVEW